MDRPVLDPLDQRLLGALAEKERTVPGSYPLTLNALRSACNQSTSRDPVSEYTDTELELAARALKERGLVRIIWAGKGSRTLKYHQLLTEALDLADDERALVTVLLLRGPQAAGELKTRTDRLHPFADRGEVEACLQRLADRPEPLVAQLARQAGQHDPRWTHLLGPRPEAAPSGEGEQAAGIDREVVIARGIAARDASLIDSYAIIADAYAEHLGEELTGQPFERWLLERLAEEANGPVADVGCGTGHLAAFLADAGADVTGIDASPAMIERARADFPDLTFEVGDLRSLLKPPRAPGWSLILAWYPFVHFAPSELSGAISALARTLDRGGRLAVAVLVGEEVRHVTSRWGRDVDLGIVLHDPQVVRDAVAAAGLRIEEWYLRGPVAGEESERLIVLARRDV